MLDRKALAWFLGIAILFSWPLFLLTLVLPHSAPTPGQSLTTTALWALAMWGPGLAAIVTTVVILKRPFKSLNLNRLGPRRFYLWAWLLPVLLSIAGGLFTLLFGLAKLDTSFSMMREAMASTGGTLPAGLIVAIQAAFSILLAPFINVLFTLGEELGWRGFLIPQLMPLGQRKAILISGAIWGLWHAPVIVQGLNYPGYPVAGIFMMIVFCVLLTAIFSWLYLNTRSPWTPALAHGAVNAIAGLPIFFFKPGFNMAFGGTLATFPAWIGMAIFIGWLIISKRLPVESREAAQLPSPTPTAVPIGR
jgi:membrane protease YdiL (CAAX protease family)